MMISVILYFIYKYGYFLYTYEYKFELEPVVRASSSSFLLSGSQQCNLTRQFLTNPSHALRVYFKFFGGVLGCSFLRSVLYIYIKKISIDLFIIYNEIKSILGNLFNIFFISNSVFTKVNLFLSSC